jgi:hypothetical protein
MRRGIFHLPLCLFALLVFAASSPPTAQAQQGGLRSKIAQLFIFGDGQNPLFLAGTADTSNPASIRSHGSHFVPSAVSENASIIGFLTDAISENVSNIPIGSTSGGETFRFEGGVPVKTSISSGPVFGERAQTLGRGRVLAGVSRNSFHFSTLRGQDLSDLRLFFTHQNVNDSIAPGCSVAQNADCSKMGVPTLENDVMLFQLDMDINVDVTSFYASYGISDRIDFSVVVPLVSTKLHGESNAQIIPFGGTAATHFFSGTPTNPDLSATRTVDGSAFGLGDLATRLKISIHESAHSGVALLADARFATGSADDLLGAGKFAARGLAIISATYGAFSPHVNVGYVYRQATEQNDAVLATVGFDHLMAERVTVAADLVSELQVGRSNLKLPPPVHYDVPFSRTLNPTTIPDMRDDIVNGSLGFKFATPGGFTIVTNALIPVNRGGLRANSTYTFGIEYSM